MDTSDGAAVASVDAAHSSDGDAAATPSAATTAEADVPHDADVDADADAPQDGSAQATSDPEAHADAADTGDAPAGDAEEKREGERAGEGEVEVVDGAACWCPGEDEAYRSFFRLQPGGEHDKLSLLACKRQGVRAEDLLERCAASLMPAPSPQQSQSQETSARAQERLRIFDQRRREQIRQLEEERNRIFVELYVYAKTKNKVKLAKMLAGNAAVQKGAADAAARVAAAATATASSSSSSASAATGGGGGGNSSIGRVPPPQKGQCITSVSPASSRSSFSPGPTTALETRSNGGGGGGTNGAKEAKDDVEQYREKQMRQVNLEKKAELDRQALQETIAVREMQAERLAQAKEKQLKREAAAAQQKRLDMMQRARDYAEVVFYEGKLQMERKTQLRAEYEDAFRGAKEAARAEKKQRSDERLRVVKERAERVFEGKAERSIVQHIELNARLRVYAAKKEHLTLRQTERASARKLAHLQKMVGITETVERQLLDAESRELQMLVEQQAAEQRVEALHEGSRRRMDEKAAKEAAAAASVRGERARVDRARDGRLEEAVARKLDKDEHLLRKELDREEALQERREDKEHRLGIMRANAERLRRKAEHRALVQRLKIELDNRDKEARDTHLRSVAIQRERSKRETDLAKHRLREEIQCMRHSAARQSMRQGQQPVGTGGTAQALTAGPSQQ